MFRDDREAMLARATALERQLADAEKAKERAQHETEEAKARAKEAAMEAKTLRERLDELPPGDKKKVSAAVRKRVLVILAIVFLLVGAFVAIMSGSARRRTRATVPSLARTPALPLATPTQALATGELSAEKVRVFLHRAVLDDTEPALRVMWRFFGELRAAEKKGKPILFMALSWFEVGRALSTITVLEAHKGPLVDHPHIEALAKEYAATVRVVLPKVAAALRYYEHRDYVEDGGAGGESFHTMLTAELPPLLALGVQYRRALAPLYAEYLEALPKSKSKITAQVVSVWKVCSAMTMLLLEESLVPEQASQALAACSDANAPLLEKEQTYTSGNNYLVGLFDNLSREAKKVLREQPDHRASELSSLLQSYVYAARQFTPR